MTKGDHSFSVGVQHDVPREITHFPKGHVKPCPYGTYESSLVTLPANGHHAVPLPSPLRHPRESGDPWSLTHFLDSHFRGNDGLGVGNDGLGGWE